MSEKIELPKRWEKVTFNDICEIISGKNQRDVVDSSGLFPIYGSGGIMGYSNAYLCDPGTTIIGRKGTIDKPIYVKEKFWNIDTAFGLSPFKNIDNKLFYYYCMGYNFKKHDKSTTIPSLAKRDLLQIIFPLPPLPEQHRIVDKIEELFSDLDNGIENLKTAQAQLVIYKHAVLKQAFEGVFTKDWRKQNSYNLDEFLENLKKQKIKAVNLKLIKKDKYFETPESQNVVYNVPDNWLQLPWKTITSNNKHAMKRGPFGSTLKKEFFVEKGYTVYEQGHAINGVSYKDRYYISEKKHTELIAFAIKPGDMIISCSGTLGRIYLLPHDCKPGIINQALLKIDLDENIILKSFFVMMFRSETFQRKLFQKSLGTAMANMVGMKELRELAIPIPSIAEQKQIIQEIESRLSVCDKLEESIEQSLLQAEALRQSILKKAFEGKLVPQDPNDEPASVLLKKIRAERPPVVAKKATASRSTVKKSLTTARKRKKS